MKKALTILSLALLGNASAATLTVWTHFGTSELQWLKDQAAAYAKASGNKVDIVSVPFDNIPDKLIQSAPKGQGPDIIVTLPQDRLGQLAAAGVRPDLVRMSCGLEDKADLIADIAQALDKI